METDTIIETNANLKLTRLMETDTIIENNTQIETKLKSKLTNTIIATLRRGAAHSINTIKRPTDTIKRPTNTIKRPTNIIKRPTNTIKRPTNTIKRPTNTVKRPTKTVTETLRRDGRHILSRDYMCLKLWDVNMESKPIRTICKSLLPLF